MSTDIKSMNGDEGYMNGCETFVCVYIKNPYVHGWCCFCSCRHNMSIKHNNFVYHNLMHDACFRLK